jgi:hypothetical protein
MARQRQAQRREIKWDFLSFPFAYGIAAGGFIGMLLAFVGGGLELAFYVFLFAFSFGNAHIIGQWFRRRTVDRRRDKDEEAERERRALAARSAASLENEASSSRRRRKRR